MNEDKKVWGTQGHICKNGKLKKKPGRHKGTKQYSNADMAVRINRIMSYVVFGKSKIENPQNIEKGVQPNTPLNLTKACLEEGITYTAYRVWVRDNPAFEIEFQKAKELRTELMQEKAENLIDEALEGTLKGLSDKDRVDYSFRLQEKTNQRYNPKNIVEAKIEEIDPNRSTEDIMRDIFNLIKPSANDGDY